MVTQQERQPATYREPQFSIRAVCVLVEAVAAGQTQGLDAALDSIERLGGRVYADGMPGTEGRALVAYDTPSGLVYGVVWHETTRSWGVHS